MEHAEARCQTTGSCVLCCLQCCLQCCLHAGCYGGLTERVQGAAFALALASPALAKEYAAVQGWGQEGEFEFVF